MAFQNVDLNSVTKIEGFLVVDRKKLSTLEEKFLKNFDSIEDKEISPQDPIVDKLIKLQYLHRLEVTRSKVNYQIYKSLNFNKDVTFKDFKDNILKVRKKLIEENLVLLASNMRQFGVREFKNKFYLPINLLDSETANELIVKSTESFENLIKQIETIKDEEKIKIVSELVEKNFFIDNEEEKRSLIEQHKIKLAVCLFKTDLENEVFKNQVIFLSPKISKQKLEDKEELLKYIAEKIKEKSLVKVFLNMVAKGMLKEEVAELLDIPLIKNNLIQKDLKIIAQLLS